jgi:hypothetical protein
VEVGGRVHRFRGARSLGRWGKRVKDGVSRRSAVTEMESLSEAVFVGFVSSKFVDMETTA